MITINDKQKQIIKWGFVAVILGAIIYTFRDLAGPILEELKKTSPLMVLIICVSSAAYELVEGWITYGFARQYNPQFSYKRGVISAFFISFYRVATLGSGAGVAAIYYFNENDIPVSKGTGMYMIEYVLHKLSIAIFSGIFFVVNWGYMNRYFGEYSIVLVAGYLLTVVIAGGLVLVICWAKLHRGIAIILDKLNKSGKLDEKITYLKEQFIIMEEAAAFLLKRGSFILITILKNLLKLAFWYGIPFLIFYGNDKVSLAQAMAITSLSVMMAAVVPAPAGIGSTEFIFTLLFSVTVGTTEAGSASLLYRFATFVFPFAAGGCIVLLRRLRKRQETALDDL